MHTLYTYVLHIFIFVNYAEVNVHKIVFLQTLAMTDMISRTPVRKLPEWNYISLEKSCYKHAPQVLNILNSDITPTAYLHNEPAAKFETLNLHMQARRRYLGNGVNDSELYRLHCECFKKQWIHFEPDEHRVQRNLNKEYNISFKIPQTSV